MANNTLGGLYKKDDIVNTQQARDVPAISFRDYNPGISPTPVEDVFSSRLRFMTEKLKRILVPDEKAGRALDATMAKITPIGSLQSKNPVGTGRPAPCSVSDLYQQEMASQAAPSTVSNPYQKQMTAQAAPSTVSNPYQKHSNPYQKQMTATFSPYTQPDANKIKRYGNSPLDQLAIAYVEDMIGSVRSDGKRQVVDNKVGPNPGMTPGMTPGEAGKALSKLKYVDIAEHLAKGTKFSAAEIKARATQVGTIDQTMKAVSKRRGEVRAQEKKEQTLQYAKNRATRFGVSMVDIDGNVKDTATLNKEYRSRRDLAGDLKIGSIDIQNQGDMSDSEFSSYVTGKAEERLEKRYEKFSTINREVDPDRGPTRRQRERAAYISAIGELEVGDVTMNEFASAMRKDGTFSDAKYSEVVAKRTAKERAEERKRDVQAEVVKLIGGVLGNDYTEASAAFKNHQVAQMAEIESVVGDMSDEQKSAYKALSRYTAAIAAATKVGDNDRAQDAVELLFQAQQTIKDYDGRIAAYFDR